MIVIRDDDAHERQKIIPRTQFPKLHCLRRFFRTRHGKFQQRGLRGGLERQKNFLVERRQIVRAEVFDVTNELPDCRAGQGAVEFHLQAQKFPLLH